MTLSYLKCHTGAVQRKSRSLTCQVSLFSNTWMSASAVILSYYPQQRLQLIYWVQKFFHDLHYDNRGSHYVSNISTPPSWLPPEVLNPSRNPFLQYIHTYTGYTDDICVTRTSPWALAAHSTAQVTLLVSDWCRHFHIQHPRCVNSKCTNTHLCYPGHVGLKMRCGQGHWQWRVKYLWVFFHLQSNGTDDCEMAGQRIQQQRTTSLSFCQEDSNVQGPGTSSF